MNNLEFIIQKYLNDAELLVLEKLGSEKDIMLITQAQNNKLIEEIDRLLRFNKRKLGLFFLGLCIIFFSSILFVFYFGESLPGIFLIISGALLSLIAVILGLRKAWLEQSMMGLIKKILNGLPPQDAVKFIEIIYFSKKLEEAA